MSWIKNFAVIPGIILLVALVEITIEEVITIGGPGFELIENIFHLLGYIFIVFVLYVLSLHLLKSKALNDD